jgi:hypothetical protein
MSAASLCAWALVGLVAGWVYHRLLDETTRPAPLVSWAQPLALFLVAAILGGTAWSTRRSVQQARVRLSADHAVNRLVLARACAYVGCLVAGGYVGYAISWLGDGSDLAAQRAVRSAVAGLAGVLVVVAGLMLERACRVPPEDDEP